MPIVGGRTPGKARQLGSQVRSAPLWRTRWEFFTDLGLFLLGAAGVYSINLVGALPGDEVLLLPLLPVLFLSKGKRAFDPRYLLFYILTLGWLLGTLVADIHAGSPLDSRLKGTARVVFFALDFMALAILINNKARRLVIFALSIVTVMLYYVWGFRGEFLLQWKFGLSSALIIVSLIVSSYFYQRRRYWICIGISFGLAALNLIYAFRSQMGIVLVSAALTLPVLVHRRTPGLARQPKTRNIVRVCLLLALAGGSAMLATKGFQWAADRGLFEEDTAQKFKTQSNGKLGVLFGGRPETLVALRAIYDNPILGHGSFAIDPKYLAMKQRIQYDYGYSETDEPEDVVPVIPTHSHLTMAWVESGILGGLLWIYILALAIGAILRISLLRPIFTPLYCYLLMNFVWDILYSPFGSINRIWGAYLVLLSYYLLKLPAIGPLSRAASGRTVVSFTREIRSRRFAS